MWYGSAAARQGRSRLCASYQARRDLRKALRYASEMCMQAEVVEGGTENATVSFRRRMYIWSRLRVLVTLVSVCLSGCAVLPRIAVAQPMRWELVAGGQSVHWNADQRWSADSIHAAAMDALSQLQREGYLFARIDSYHVDQQRVTLHATLGTPAVLETVRIFGARALDSLQLLRMLESQPARPFNASSVERDARRLVAAYTDAGYHRVRVMVQDLGPVAPDSAHVALTFRVAEGGRPRLGAIALPGRERTTAGFVARVIGLRTGMPVLHFDAHGSKKRLEDTEVFEAVDTPVLAMGADSSLVVRIPVSEAPPGAFDLALGYERNDTGGALVGSGHLVLRNLFGWGRMLALMLQRVPGQVSRIRVHVRDPFAFGSPLSLGARFEGLQQDSTYGQRTYGIEVGYRFEGRMRVFSTLSREVTRPGLVGLRIEGGQQRIPVATALFAGLGMRVRTLDSRINPQRGFIVEAEVESGRKDRTRRIVRADTTEETARVQQARLRARVRLFFPTASRQALVLGGETMLLRSRELDESDLFRFGGANSLRGYDEQRFRVPFASRVLVEYRYLPDAASHALVFFDVGYVDASRLSKPFQGIYPGFGVGFQLDTDAGRISVTAAAATDAPTAVRVHLGISLGL